MNGLRLQNKTIKVNYPRDDVLRRVSWLSSNPSRESEPMPHLRKTLFLQVSFARPSSDSIKFANLYICGIPKQWTSKELEGYFTSCGKIITSRILLDSSTGSIRRRSHLTLFAGRPSSRADLEHWDLMFTDPLLLPISLPLSVISFFVLFSFDMICFSFRFLLRVPLRIQSNFPIFIFQISHGRWLSRSSRLCLPSLVVLFRRRFFAIPKQVDPFDFVIDIICLSLHHETNRRAEKTFLTVRCTDHRRHFGFLLQVHRRASDSFVSINDPKQKWRLVNWTALFQKVHFGSQE